MSTCIRCGHSFGVDDRFCKNCGIALNTISFIAETKSLSAGHYYDRGLDAAESRNFDTAIRELDACLCANPEPQLAMSAYFNLSAAIWEKFHFNERRGAEIADDEYVWVRGCNICLRRALKLYESLPRSRQLEAETIKLHQAVKGSLGPTIFYGSYVYNYGRREPRKVSGLPALRCLSEVDIPID